MHYVLAISVVALYIYLRFGKKPLAVIVAILALLALAKGLFLVALPLLFVAYYLTKGPRSWQSKQQESIPETERKLPTITSRYLGLTLSPNTGRIEGWVRNGPNKGTHLDELREENLKDLKVHYEVADKESAAFLYAYLDQAHPTWRSAERHFIPEDTAISAAPLTKNQALAALGLPLGATIEDVKKAHRALMKKFHPDQGGAEVIAAKLNMAKDKLII